MASAPRDCEWIRPNDITPLSMYEELEYVGMEGQCNRCHRIFYIPVAIESGRCPLCPDETGWVSPPGRFNTMLFKSILYDVHVKHCDKLQQVGNDPSQRP